MSPAADFLVKDERNYFPEDDYVNNRAFLTERYRRFLSANVSRFDVKKYQEDVGGLWNPLTQFSNAPRWPLELPALSNDTLDELNDTASLMKKLKSVDDEYSTKRQDPFQTEDNAWRVLTMPIKLPTEKKIFLPSNLLKSRGICEIVRHAASFVEAQNAFYFQYYWMLCTIHISLNVLPDTTQRDPIIHVDGMMGKNKNTGEVPLWPKQHLVFSTSIPTTYYPVSWNPPVTENGQPDYNKNWFQHMNVYVKDVLKCPPHFLRANTMYMFSPYLLHEATVNKEKHPVKRFFIRIGFGNTHYNGPIYTVNPRLGKFKGLEDRARLHRPAFENIDTQTLFRRQPPKKLPGDVRPKDINRPTF